MMRASGRVSRSRVSAFARAASAGSSSGVSGNLGCHAASTRPRQLVRLRSREGRADGLARADVEEAVRSGHARRARNPISADWLVRFGRHVVAYNHPDRDDREAARIVTVWRA